MINLIILRHPETRGDRQYVLHNGVYRPYAPGKAFLKGQSRSHLYRLSDLGILQAIRIGYHLKGIQEREKRTFHLWKNPSLRSSEAEEISKIILTRKGQYTVKEYESDNLEEKCFGPIEGMEVAKLKEALRRAQRTGELDYDTLANVLTYSDDNFKRLRKYLPPTLGKEKAEYSDFALARAVNVVTKVLNQSKDGDYIVLYTHKIFSRFLMSALEIIDLNAGEVPIFRNYDQKRRIVRPLTLEPATYIHARIIKHGERYRLVDVPLGQSGYLHNIREPLSDKDLHRVSKYRELIRSWYEERSIDPDKEPESIDAFRMHDGQGGPVLEIFSPLELPDKLKAASLEAVAYHLQKRIRGGPNDLADWIEASFGDQQLASIVRDVCYANRHRTNPKNIRAAVHNAVAEYLSSIQ